MHFTPPRIVPTFLTFLAFLAFLFPGSFASAGEPWIAPGNTQVRHDVQLLVDSGVIDLPMSAWPIAASDLANALGSIPRDSIVSLSRLCGRGPGSGLGDVPKPLSAAQLAAIARLRSLASEGNATLGVEVGAAARPTQLRTFADTPREEGEVSLYAASFVGATVRRATAGDRGGRPG